jgi:hypothetical protein
MDEKTLLEVLTGPLAYTEYFAIYARRIDGEFKPESQARIGQHNSSQEEADGFERFAANATIFDFYYSLGLRAFRHMNTRKLIRAAKALIDLKNEFEKIDSLHIGTH